MALQITLTKTPGSIALPRNNHIFDHRGGTFGRSDSNTWVLPDPDKFLSSCHCAVVCVENQFYLEDKSTNGTFVNGGFEPLGRGVRHQLRDGDFFEIGDYRFSIQLDQKISVMSGSPFEAVPSYQDSGKLFDALPGADLFGASIDDAPAMFDQQQDPLALWDKRPQSGYSPEPVREYSDTKENNVLLDDFVGLGKSVNDAAFPVMDISSGLDQAMSWPAAKSENLIPENWDDDLLGGASDLRARAPIVSDAVKIDDDWASPFTANSTAVARDMPFDIPTPKTRTPLVEDILSPEALPPSPVFIPKQQVVKPIPEAPLAVEVKAAPPTVAPAPAVNSPASSAANHVLVEALGLDMSRLSEVDILEINRVSGLLIREIVDGMLGVLRSRTSIKNEFRMNVTTIQPIENNPLKFSVCVDDALENLFIKKTNAYKKPVEAFREGFQEIAEHQLAMIAGIRHGFEAMMERFNPEQLEKNFSKQVKASVIPGMQKAKLWSSYVEYYQGFTDNMESSFQHLFGSDFVSAYEDQLRRLAAARKRGDNQ
jgi:type VI secretion system protein